MSYRLEISFDLRRVRQGNNLKKEIISLANKCGYESCYIDQEINGHGRIIKRNNTVFILSFPEDPKYIISFIRKIKEKNNIYIESIGFDNIKFTLLYASKNYLNMMQKDKMKEFINNSQRLDNIQYQEVIEAM